MLARRVRAYKPADCSTFQALGGSMQHALSVYILTDLAESVLKDIGVIFSEKTRLQSLF